MCAHTDRAFLSSSYHVHGNNKECSIIIRGMRYGVEFMENSFLRCHFTRKEESYSMQLIRHISRNHLRFWDSSHSQCSITRQEKHKTRKTKCWLQPGRYCLCDVNANNIDWLDHHTTAVSCAMLIMITHKLLWVCSSHVE